MLQTNAQFHDARWFTVGDAEKLEEDLNALMDIFIAEGEGVQTVKVEQAAHKASHVLNVMTLDTDLLIDHYNQNASQDRYLDEAR